MISVFVSRPTWIPPEFEEGLNGFLGLLETLELNPRTLGTTDYPTKSPLDDVIALLDQCSGAVILGYPQIRVSAGTIKAETVHNALLATEWNHIEAGLAYARHLPLLVIHHLGIVRGIFDRGAINSFIYERDLTVPQWPLSRDISGSIAKWKAECVVPRAERLPSADVSSASPSCPNGARLGQPFLMSPIPKEFVDLENASHECTQCKYKAMYLDKNGQLSDRGHR